MSTYTRKLLMPKVDVPEGQVGRHRIERFEVTKAAAERELLDAQLAAFSGRVYRPVPEGWYTALLRGDSSLSGPVMSDTPSEMRDHYAPVREAKKRGGRIFIAGLGIGMVLQACLEHPEVEHATVLELEADVIALVGPHYEAKYGDRLTIIQGDALDWRPPKGTHHDPFTVAWFDIWDNKCIDNLKDITKLKRRWARWALWRGFWAEWDLRVRKERGGW